VSRHGEADAVFRGPEGTELQQIDCVLSLCSRSSPPPAPEAASRFKASPESLVSVELIDDPLSLFLMVGNVGIL